MRRAGVLGCVVLLATGGLSAAPLTVARLKYGGGGDWYANPTGLVNLIRAVNDRTAIRLSPTPAVVEPGSPRLFDYPIVFATGHGNIEFTPAERQNLRRYLLGGGFLHVDDNYGFDEHFRPRVRELFPDRKLTELPFSHPLYHCFYGFSRGLPKIHEHHGGPPHGYGVLDRGRVMLFYSYNTDINDGWEDAEVHNDSAPVRESALRMGVNIIVYALTH
jgi:hypothetical protein